jgi:glycerol kinase
MAAPDHVLAIDQGTTSNRAIVFDRTGLPVATAQRELRQFYPHDGWVEHDPEDIWNDTLAVCRAALHQAGLSAGDVAAIGITNQRETTVLWDRATGQPLHNAIVWQDRRTAEACRRLTADGVEPLVTERTGLLIDPYFSATKLAWLLDHVPGARARAERDELCFGTIDSFLLYRLTSGRVHATDATNAARTLLFDIHRQDWDRDMLRLFGIPAELLPAVFDNSTLFGTTRADLFGASIPITGMAGDQQAATFGQACFEPGMIKSTYGTGCFALMNIGEKAGCSANRLLCTLAYRLDGRPTYAIEGSIFVAGAAIQWLRDGLRVIADAAASERHANDLPDTQNVYFVPAFTGLGAPHWDPDARGAILGLTRGTTRAHLVRAALEAIAFEVRDVVDVMTSDAGVELPELSVDGGAAANDLLCQVQADQLQVPVRRPQVAETTALGAAFLAGLATGVWSSTGELADTWALDKRFEPGERDDAAYRRWQEAVQRSKGWARL